MSIIVDTKNSALTDLEESLYAFEYLKRFIKEADLKFHNKNIKNIKYKSFQRTAEFDIDKKCIHIRNKPDYGFSLKIKHPFVSYRQNLNDDVDEIRGLILKEVERFEQASDYIYSITYGWADVYNKYKLSLIRTLYKKANSQDVKFNFTDEVFDDINLYKGVFDQAENIGQIEQMIISQQGRGLPKETFFTYSPKLNKLIWNGSLMDKNVIQTYGNHQLITIGNRDIMNLIALHRNENQNYHSDKFTIKVSANLRHKKVDIDRIFFYRELEYSQVNITDLSSEVKSRLDEWKNQSALALKKSLKTQLRGKYIDSTLRIN